MSGAYAHLTLVASIATSAELESASISRKAIPGILRNLHFVDLGAVSPDYPYLYLTSPSAKKWADLMHQEKLGQMIRTGIEHIRDLSGGARETAFAWPLGYVAHVGTDMTIHPVVALKVGRRRSLRFINGTARLRLCSASPRTTGRCRPLPAIWV